MLAQQFEALIAVDDDGAMTLTRDRTLLIQSVETLAAAIHWLNLNAHQRAMGICTALQAEVNQFTAEANGVELYINASPRFYRNPVNAIDIALGMSVQTGRVGLRALTRSQPVFNGYGEEPAPKS